jgi:pimeloyl-ACP methyl ester carboxylesterase
MRRSTKIAAFAVAMVAAGWLSRCDSRTPGEAAPRTADESIAGGGVRRDLRFPCGDAVCAAWLYLPATAPAPVVVMAHGFSGTRDVGLAAIAERFARAGFAAFVFDYRHFGASAGAPRQIVDPARQLEDWRAAIRFVRSRSDVDASKIALFGSSLGGGHALLVAADDPDIRAVVAQAPLVDSSVEGDATSYGVAWIARLLLSGWADLALSAFGADPLLLPAIAPRGGFGMIVDDAAYASFEKIVAPGSTYENAVAARSPFLFDDYDPALTSGVIRAPVLLIASRSDRFAPFAAVESYRDRASNAEIALFDGDHFDVYSPPASEQAAAAATAFLERHLR